MRPAMRVRVSLSTGSLFGYSLDRIFGVAAGLGLDGVEVMLTERQVTAGPAALQALIDRHGVPVLSLHFPPFGHRSLTDLLAAYERTAELAAALPTCEAVVIHTSLAPTMHDHVAQTYLQSLARCQRRLRGATARLTIENRGVTTIPARPAYLDDLVNLRRLAEEWDVGLTYDVGHAASWGLDIIRAWEALGPRVDNIHLSNSHARGWPASLPLLRGHLRDHQPLDAGVLPIDDFLQALATARNTDLLTLEISPIALHLPWPWQARARLAASVTRCRAALASMPRRVLRNDVMT